MGALLEEFRIAEFLDVFFGELVILDEGFAGFVGAISPSADTRFSAKTRPIKRS
jgi:hypothetical protein